MQTSQLKIENRARVKIQPMPVWESLLIFVLITLLIIFCFYIFRPYLESLGLTEYAAYLLSLSGVAILQLVWVFVVCYLEGDLFTIEAFVNRMRLHRIHAKTLAWSIGLGLFMFLMTVSFSPLISKWIAMGYLPLPDQIPDYINPLKQQSIAQIKLQMISQGVIAYIPLVLILNIFGEEFFWRGVVLPRQELQHGKYAFLLHGFIWAFTHLFQYWLLLPILFSSLALCFLVQRHQNTWIGILAHFINNVFPFIIMIFIPV